MRKGAEFSYKRFGWTSVIMGFVGLFIGTISAFARPYASTDSGAHLEAMIEFFLIMPAISFFIVAWNLKLRMKTALITINIQLGVLWLLNIVGHVVGSNTGAWIGLSNARLIGDFFGISIAFWFGASILGSLIYLTYSKLSPLHHASTNCPSCGYSLKGLGPAGNCPECGTTFTATSLGVSESELIV